MGVAGTREINSPAHYPLPKESENTRPSFPRADALEHCMSWPTQLPLLGERAGVRGNGRGCYPKVAEWTGSRAD